MEVKIDPKSKIRRKKGLDLLQPREREGCYWTIKALLTALPTVTPEASFRTIFSFVILFPAGEGTSQVKLPLGSTTVPFAPFHMPLLPKV